MGRPEQKGPSSSLGHRPEGKWEFDDAVTEVFEDMLRRSIPQYDVMREMVFRVAQKFIRGDNGFVVDLGCSRGGALAQFVDEYGARCRYVGVDVSEPMLEAARHRFEGMAQGVVRFGGDLVHIEHRDLRESYPDVSAADVTLAVLTLQFIPINYRHQILKNVYDHTRHLGAFVMVEKVLGAGALTDRLMVDLYHSNKKANGYSEEEIDRKRLALEGVLVPVSARWNEEMLHAAGFREVECVWRWMNFAAWVAVRT